MYNDIHVKKIFIQLNDTPLIYLLYVFIKRVHMCVCIHFCHDVGINRRQNSVLNFDTNKL